MATFDSRRKLSGRELLPAVGVGMGVAVATGLVAGYVTRLFLQRERITGGSGAAPRKGDGTTGTAAG